MQRIRLDETLIQGAVSVEVGEGWVQPWRLPHSLLSLFPPNALEGRAAFSAGVRVCFTSNTERVALEFAPSDQTLQFDCVVDNQLVESRTIEAGESQVSFEALAPTQKRVEIYLSQKAPVRLRALAIDGSATFDVGQERRPKWIAYGSSITQCAHAASPAQTWPALVARQWDLNLTCLGFGSNCHLDPEVARVIRSLPAAMVSMCVGTNICGMSSLSPRTFAPCLIGFIRTIREGHPDVPIIVMSPIINPRRETTPNDVGFTLTAMRGEIVEVVSMLQELGDDNLHYVDGLKVFGSEHVELLEYGAHPGPTGYRVLAEGFMKNFPQVSF